MVNCFRVPMHGIHVTTTRLQKILKSQIILIFGYENGKESWSIGLSIQISTTKQIPNELQMLCIGYIMFNVSWIWIYTNLRLAFYSSIICNKHFIFCMIQIGKCSSSRWNQTGWLHLNKLNRIAGWTLTKSKQIVNLKLILVSTQRNTV